MLVPVVVFVAAAGLAAFTLLDDDEVPIIDTSEIDTGTPIDTGNDADDDADTGSDPASSEQERPSPEWMDPIRVENQSMAIGDPDAPLVMVAFESFGCLWCGNFHRLTMPQVYDEYVDTGLLRVESRMMPYEDRAIPGALVGIAAGMQDRYWELAEVLYPFISGDGDPPTDRDLSASEIGGYRERQSEAGLLAEVERWSDEIDLDYERFLIDYRSDEARRLMQDDTDIGYAVGFTGTPSIVVNGVPLGGWVSFETFDEFLTSILDASTGTAESVGSDTDG
jgi:protein-disulfide isomerase